MLGPRVERVAIVISVLLVLIVLDMVRRKKLREKYSLIWLFTVAAMTILVVWEGLLLSITSLIGATNPSSTLFLFGILFALVILLHLSNKVSDFSTQLRILAKEVAMLNAQLSGFNVPLGSGGDSVSQGGADVPGKQGKETEEDRA
ncbi:MAG: DUF2304 domain-containing protein [Candidatus Eiseniibacteriota bacterium]|nr:MAG: DUF2304 domain-containing protein [Candidatus Eisenbacteria bacterium]